ncbi:MAG: DnaJ domain-containing protein [Acidobacteriota bacterium]
MLTRKGYSELNLLVAAGLISGFKQSSPEEVYGKAMKCFDVLMGILEDSDTAGKISKIVSIPFDAVIKSVQTVIDLLLFNAGNDPYMSLCLPRYASEEQVSRRWKRLIVFYHPDKYADRVDYEERAKRINEAYEAIQKIREDLHVDETVRTIVKRNACYSSFNGKAMKHLSKKKASSYYKYLSRLPTLILVFSILVTIISILLFIYAS